MIIERYKLMLDELTANSSIEILKRFTNFEIRDILSASSIKRKQQIIRELSEIEIPESDFIYTKLSDISVAWQSILPGKVLSGGFRMNAMTDALYIRSHFWKSAFSLAPDKEMPDHLKHLNRLSWFQKSADETTQAMGCFIIQPGKFPPPAVIYYRGWYDEKDFGFEKYLTTMVENYAFESWQFFYVDFPKDIKDLDEILDNMKFAVEMLPEIFPDKDWSYHAKKYEDTLKRLNL